MSKRNLGILSILLSAVCFALMSFFVRASGDLPTMQKAFFRNAVAMVVIGITLFRSGEGFLPKKGNIPYLMLRSVCGIIGILGNFYAIDKMNISDANMLNKLSPFFAIIFSWLLLKEKAGKKEWGAVFMAFIGAMLVAKPSFRMESVPAMIGILGGMGAGAAYTFVRMVSQRGERGSVIIFFFSVFSTLVTLPLMIADFEPMTAGQLLCLLAAGAAATGGQIFITRAYSFAPAREISVFDYSQVIFAAVLGFIFLNQLPDIFSILGYVIIIGAAVWKWRCNNMKA